MRKWGIRPIGDGDCIIFEENSDGTEKIIDHEPFEEYGEAEAFCYENGATPFWE